MLRTTNEVDLNTKLRFLLNSHYRHRCILIGCRGQTFLPKRTIFDLVALDSNRIGGVNLLGHHSFLISSSIMVNPFLFFQIS